MKKYLIIAVAALLLVTVPRVSYAQTKAAPTSVAHINLDSLLDIMPAFKKASDSAQMFYAELERQMYTMNLELQKKGAEYDSLNKMWSAPIRAIKEKEIYDLQQNIQNFQQTAQQSYTDRRTQLLIPIFESIQKAVKDVAIERGYTYVLDSSKSAGVVLYAADSVDIFQAVKKKLGIPDVAKAPGAPGTGTPK